MNEFQGIISRIRPNSKRHELYIQGWEVLHYAKILATVGQRAEIITEVKRYLRYAQKYHFNRLAAEFAAFLHYYYSVGSVNKTQAKQFLGLLKKYSELANTEDEVKADYAEMIYKINDSRSPSPVLLEELEQLCNKLKPLLHKSAAIDSYIYTLLIAQAYNQHDYKKVIQLCKEVIERFEAESIEQTTSFYYNLTPALIIQKQYDEAQTVIQKAVQKSNKGSYSWSIHIYYRFILELHRHNYTAAHALFKTAERKRHINKAMREQWLIVRGYVQFLMRVGRIEGSGHFKLGKFLNEVPVFTADKAGNNVNIIILQLLHNLGRNNEFLIDRKEAFAKYAERYLKSGSRARLLLRLLLKIPHYNFDKATILRKTEKLSAQLKAVSLQVDNSEIEIIPYDDVWDLTLELL